MSKNLVVGVVGDSSLHHSWLGPTRNFDLFLVYYGDEAGKYHKDGDYYDIAKGTKFVILAQIVERHKTIFEQYDAIFVPDDDIYFTPSDCNRFLELFYAYDLHIAQPSIIGYLTLPLIANVTFSSIRYTNWVELMCPCFSKEAFKKCVPSFRENISNWGIEYLWNRALGEPKDKIAIIDEVIMSHTRPLCYGDTYYNNGTSFEFAMREHNELIERHGLDDEKVIYKTVPRDLTEFHARGSEDKIYPDVNFMKDLIKSLRGGK